MDAHTAITPKFAICVQRDEQSLLTIRKIYPVLPDDSAAQSSYLRIMDDEGEDYLYPARYFILVEFPSEVEQALLAAA